MLKLKVPLFVIVITTTRIIITLL